MTFPDFGGSNGAGDRAAPKIEFLEAAEPGRGGLNLVRIFGVQIAIDFSWIVIFLLVLWSLAAGYFPQGYPGHTTAGYWLVGGVATVLFFISVLIHELSHAVVGNFYGQGVRKITLFIFGGMAHLSHEPDDPVVEAKIAGVGPLTSLALAAVFHGWAAIVSAASQHSLWAAMFDYLAFINLALAAFNLLPGFPLDGGRLARALFWWRSGDLRKATSRAADWGKGLAIGLVLLGGLEIFSGALVGGLWLIFIAMFLRSAAVAAYNNTLAEHLVTHIRVQSVMIPDPVTIDAETSLNDAIEHYFLRYGYSGFPVVDRGKAVGLISLLHIRECPPHQRAYSSVRDVMRPLENARIAPSASISEALSRMQDAHLSRMLVMSDEQILGLVTRSGIARYVQLQGE